MSTTSSVKTNSLTPIFFFLLPNCDRRSMFKISMFKLSKLCEEKQPDIKIVESSSHEAARVWPRPPIHKILLNFVNSRI